jgi:endonuclease YncB( thermonuclease family)
VKTLLLSLLIAFGVVLHAAPPKAWKTHTATYVENAHNDGDSFHVRVDGVEKIIRLYGVDAPETTTWFKDRVTSQARDMGLSFDDTLHRAQDARIFTRAALSRRVFTVFTAWSQAPGRSKLPRYYAYVLIDDVDLGDALLNHQLARRHGYDPLRRYVPPKPAPLDVPVSVR